MTDDRALLEAAARAAGLELESTEIEAGPYHDGLRLRDSYDVWNPLEDDGDALRLAVKLGLDLNMWPKQVYAGRRNSYPIVEQEIGSDPYAATRRAIVRAAAASLSERMEG